MKKKGIRKIINKIHNKDIISKSNSRNNIKNVTTVL